MFAVSLVHCLPSFQSAQWARAQLTMQEVHLKIKIIKNLKTPLQSASLKGFVRRGRTKQK